jgi:hypothetical protein
MNEHEWKRMKERKKERKDLRVCARKKEERKRVTLLISH